VAIADTLRRIGGAGTVIARVGGEEFLVAEHNGTTLWNLMLAFAIGQKAQATVNQFGRQCISRGDNLILCQVKRCYSVPQYFSSC